MKNLGQQVGRAPNMEDLSGFGSVFAQERLNSQSQFLARQGSELDLSKRAAEMSELSQYGPSARKQKTIPRKSKQPSARRVLLPQPMSQNYSMSAL